MSDKIRHQIVERIKILKDQKGWSWEKLAYSAGISKSGMCQIKNEQNSPTLITLLKICVALNITPAEFFNFEINTNDL